MARFFIDRPIFAWVIAIVIMLAGLAFVYWLRAKTEERHLASIDPAYAIYTDEVRQRHRRWLGFK